MKIKGVKIKNFKSIKELNIKFPDSGILVLVGENNSGKSNIIRSIDAICGESWYGKDKLEDHDFYLRNRANQIEVNLYFDNNRSVNFKPTNEDWGVKYYEDWKQTSRLPYGQNIKDDYPSTYLGADRSFDKHLSFYDWTLVGRIRKAFHKKVSEELKEEIEKHFQGVIDCFDKIPSFKKFKSDFSNFYNVLYPSNSTKLSIDFKAFTPSNYFKTLQILGIDPDLSDKPLDLEELGEGARNLILISLLRSYAENFKGNDGEISGILALEEPELFLHPQARRHLASILREIADSGIQVIISTHSDSFIDTEFFDSIGRVVKISDEESKNKHTKLIQCSKKNLLEHCVKTGVSNEKVTEKSLVEYYKTTSNIRLNEGFFSRCLILVEGETEELALPIYLKELEIDCDALGISIIPVNGKNQLPKYWRLYSQFDIPIIIIFDNDNNNGKEKSNQNLATCFGLKLKEITDKIEIYKSTESENEPRTPIFILENNFEDALRKELESKGFSGIYEKLESDAKEIIKPIGSQQKGAIARFIASKLCSDYSDFESDFIYQLSEIIDGIIK